MANISIDFFGTLNEDADVWQDFMKYLMEDHKIYVVSGPWPKDLEEKLRFGGYKKNIHYTGIFSILDYLSKGGWGVWFDEDHDSWYSHETAWWVAKAQICQNNQIALHVDSDIRHAKAFNRVSTRFVHLNSPEGENLLAKWYRDVKNAALYDWEDEYAYMSGFVPM